MTDQIAVTPLGEEPGLGALVTRAFAERRHALEPERSARLLRAGAEPIDDLCLAVRIDGRLVGALLAWPVRLDALPLTLIGPVAVAPEHQGTGVGAALMTEACARLIGPAVLVGDPDYYARWRFAAEPTRRWRVHGHVERHRLLARPFVGPVPTEGTLLRASGGPATWGDLG